MSRGGRNRQKKNHDPLMEMFAGPSTPATRQNSMAEFIWRNYLMDLCLTKHEWHNLPEGVDPRYMNLTIYWRGGIVFFRDDDSLTGQVVAHRGVSNGNLNIYGQPISMSLIAPNGKSWIRENKDFRAVYERMSRIPSATYVDYFARRLASISRTIDTNLLQQKAINLVITSEETRLTMENILAARAANESVITVVGREIGEAVDTFTAMAPYLVDKLNLAHQWELDQAYTFLGINNANQNKKERLVESEVSANDEQVTAARLATLMSLREGIRLVNQKFGTDIEVYNSTDTISRNHEYRTDLQLQAQLDGGTDVSNV